MPQRLHARELRACPQPRVADAVRQGDAVSVSEEQQVGRSGLDALLLRPAASARAIKSVVAALLENEKLKATAAWCPQRDAPSVLVSTIM